MTDRLVVGQMAANCYVYTDGVTQDALIIDPGDDAAYIEDFLNRRGLVPAVIVATHGHFDHAMAALELQVAYNLPFYLHGDDAFLIGRMSDSARHFLGISYPVLPPAVTGTVSEGDTVRVGRRKLSVLHVPGHTPGSIALYEERDGVCFVGDLLFAGGGVGRTDFRYSDGSKLARSISRITGLPGKTVLYPGHGEPWTAGEARQEHPEVV